MGDPTSKQFVDSGRIDMAWGVRGCMSGALASSGGLSVSV